MTALDTDADRGEAILRMAKACARRRLPMRLHGYLEDVAAEAALVALETRERGIPTSWRTMHLATSAAIRSIFGDRRYRQPEHAQVTKDGAVDAIIAAQQDDRALCLRRLQSYYATLTDQQQAALLAILTEEPLTEVAARMGTSMGSLSSARTTAIARLRDPGAYDRIACERDPKRNARERQRRYRARKTESA